MKRRYSLASLFGLVTTCAAVFAFIRVAPQVAVFLGMALAMLVFCAVVCAVEVLLTEWCFAAAEQAGRFVRRAFGNGGRELEGDTGGGRESTAARVCR